MCNVRSVAHWFLMNLGEVSNKKMQKLLYYTYAWHLVLFNESSSAIDERLFEGEFEAWVHGPVLPMVYNELKKFSWLPIQQDFYRDYKVDFSEDVLDLLNQIKDVYGGYSGNDLESISHQEDPWKLAREGYAPGDVCNTIISDKSMYDYYVKRLV